MSDLNGSKRGRPVSTSVLDRAKKLAPIVTVAALADLLELDKRQLYRIVETSKVEDLSRTARAHDTPIPVPIKRHSKSSHLRWFRDDVIRWIQGSAA